MNIQLIFSTFVMVFFAELGDKTQLTSMAAAAGNKSPLAVFIGASAALVFSTFLAVTLGGVISRAVPPKYIKITAGVVFLIFGLIYIVSAFRDKKAALVKPRDIHPGILTRQLIKSALTFEKSTLIDYKMLAAKAETPEARDVLKAIAEEEAGHIAHLENDFKAPSKKTPLTTIVPRSWPEAKLTVDKKGTIHDALKNAAIHELAVADLYEAFAGQVPFPSLKAVFLHMAQEEREHARRIRQLI